MFDIGFWELAIIAIIALLVVGPDRLPEFARTTGLWVGKARRFFSDVKRDIDRELRAEELKSMIKPQGFEEIHEIIEETKTTMTDAADTLSTMDAANSPPSTDSDEKPDPDNMQTPRS